MQHLAAFLSSLSLGPPSRWPTSPSFRSCASRRPSHGTTRSPKPSPPARRASPRCPTRARCPNCASSTTARVTSSSSTARNSSAPSRTASSTSQSSCRPRAASRFPCRAWRRGGGAGEPGVPSRRRTRITRAAAARRWSRCRCRCAADGVRPSDQGAIWDEIDDEVARGWARVRHAGRQRDVREGQRPNLDTSSRGSSRIDGQVGAIFAIRGQIAGLDVFDSPRTWASLMPKLVRSYGLDALDMGIGGDGFAEPSPRRFLDAVSAARVHVLSGRRRRPRPALRRRRDRRRRAHHRAGRRPRRGISCSRCRAAVVAAPNVRAPELIKCHETPVHTIFLWLDDIRPAPRGFTHARTIEEAKALLETGVVAFASLDHDLGACGRVRGGTDSRTSGSKGTTTRRCRTARTSAPATTWCAGWKRPDTGPPFTGRPSTAQTPPAGSAWSTSSSERTNGERRRPSVRPIRTRRRPMARRFTRPARPASLASSGPGGWKRSGLGHSRPLAAAARGNDRAERSSGARPDMSRVVM